MATSTAPSAILPAPVGGIGGWIKHHDEHWLFVLIYLGMAVGLSIFVSLFWLLVVVAFHFALELIRQAFYRKTYSSVLLHALWEIKMDLGLVLLALTLVLYIEVVLGILGLQSAARAAAASRAVHVGARTGSRAGASVTAAEQWVRGILLAFDEMARVTYATIMMKKGKGGADGEPAEGDQPPASADATPEPEQAPLEHMPDPAWGGTWGMADHIGLAMVVVGLILLLAVPHLTIHDWSTALITLLEELQPLPM